MARSSKPSWVFLNTSLTMRQRLTPAMICSMTTRILEISRLASLSSAESLPPRGFF